MASTRYRGTRKSTGAVKTIYIFGSVNCGRGRAAVTDIRQSPQRHLAQPDDYAGGRGITKRRAAAGV